MKINAGKIALKLLLSALLLAGCATPQDKQAQADRDALCAVLDTNKDGKISKEEFMAQTSDKAKALEVYEKCDTSKKGYLTYNEFWAQGPMLPPGLIITTSPVLRPVR
jgi:Ca2+-binding EF-hand superfamily protein